MAGSGQRNEKLSIPRAKENSGWQKGLRDAPSYRTKNWRSPGSGMVTGRGKGGLWGGPNTLGAGNWVVHARAATIFNLAMEEKGRKAAVDKRGGIRPREKDFISAVNVHSNSPGGREGKGTDHCGNWAEWTVETFGGQVKDVIFAEFRRRKGVQLQLRASRQHVVAKGGMGGAVT